MRVVLDTDVVVAATRSDQGAAFQWLLAALERRITVLLSVPLCLEYEAVLTRPDYLAAAGATAEEMAQLLDALAEPVEVSFLWRPLLRDPNDEMVLEAAVNGRAEWLLTFNSGPAATPKGLRHAFAIAALAKGVPLNMVRKWLGHAQISTTAIYGDAIGAEETALAARLWEDG